MDEINLFFDMDWSDSDQFNIAVSVWLADDATGRELSVTDEVMFWLKSPFFSPGGTQTYENSNELGDYTVFHEPAWFDHSGVNSNSWSYTAVQFELDQNSEVLDLDGLLLEMVSNDLISGDHFLRSVEIGAEIHGSNGWWQINSLALETNSGLESIEEYVRGSDQNDSLRAGDGDDTFEAAGGDDSI